MRQRLGTALNNHVQADMEIQQDILRLAAHLTSRANATIEYRSALADMLTTLEGHIALLREEGELL